MHTEQDRVWLQYALNLAREAAAQNEVPVGAVLVAENRILGEGYNQPIKSHDPTAHAEIIALRQAAKKISNYRLVATTLYVTLEPCAMCAGALLHARIKRLVYGAYDQKTGVISSKMNLSDIPSNHKIECSGGLLELDCVSVLQDFFRTRRCNA
jgi:tRNA(adenine34) deaminase